MANPVDVRRQRWVAGAAVQCPLEYWDGQDWQSTNANIDVVSRSGDTATGIVASTGASTGGRFDGRSVTLDLVRSIARLVP
jgi:hypothetical protein